MTASVWYISKYAVLPLSNAPGTRGFMIMRELARKGLQCLIITSDSNHLASSPEFDGPSKTMEFDGVQTCWVRTRKYRGAKSIGRILSWLDFEWRLWRLPKQPFRRPEAVIVSSLSPLTIINGLLLRQRYGCKLIFEVRDIWPLTLIETGKFSSRNPFVLALGMVERLAYKKADVIVGTMPNLGEHVEVVLGYKKPAYCIPMGVDDEVANNPASLPTEYEATHIPQGKFIVCYAGTIGIDNALDTLFACARTMKDNHAVHFLIVGEGGLKAKYQQECADLPNVSFAPRVPRNLVQAVLERCSLLYFSVHPSKVWKYGQSLNKVIDYMLAGKPIVASYTGFPSMINVAGGGTFVPAGDVGALRDEILRYYRMSPEERAAIGAASREWVLINRHYEKLADDYLTLILSKAPGQ